jgi:glutamate N-acetyltransferase / amino-acid N-acetyltransferase
VEPNEVLVASTGVIGQNLPLEKLKQGLRKLAPPVLKGKSDAKSAVEAIMTTDLMPKTARREVMIDKRKITIWGCVKGAGMIHPVLKPLHATMLAFIFTDAAITPFALDKALRPASEKTFNCVSVDGDTSTNDTVLILANGAALNKTISDRDKNLGIFEAALTGVCLDLAKMIAADGEGATKFVEIEVRNADTERNAKKVAETIATSPLVKTAVFGCDANWGRIIAAAGRAGVKFNPEKVDIYFDRLLVARRGGPAGFSEAKALKILKRDKVRIVVDLHQGRQSAKYFTCDFSYDYVKINGSYRS